MPLPPNVDPTVALTLALPGHVAVWAGGRWRPGWLVARGHEQSGWVGLVQYADDDDREVTEEVPAERITAADTWLSD
jgi:hypothetical protein